MRLQCNIVFSAFLLSAVNGAPSCDDGWMKYNDEVCIKAFEDLVTYAEATELCASQGDSQGSLVMVKIEEMQKFLAEFTEEISDYIWLGGSYDVEASAFLWQDGTNLTYTNWQVGYPRNISNGDACIEMRPGEIKSIINWKGKWAHATCKKRNLVICQKPSTWTINDAVAEITRIRRKLEETSEHLNTVAATVVPVGSTYIEYYNQPSPQYLWPTFTWQDVSSSYAGLFFRVSGGASAAWGSTQAECAPRITEMAHAERTSGQYVNPLTIPANGWSDYRDAGESYAWAGTRFFEALKFHTTGCEVRPRNQAVRIWKRTR